MGTLLQTEIDIKVLWAPLVCQLSLLRVDVLS